MEDIKPGDLVTLKGMVNQQEKPIGMVKRKWATDDIEILWLNEDLRKRFALHYVLSSNKLEVISEADQ